jgi:hypothetical protein
MTSASAVLAAALALGAVRAAADDDDPPAPPAPAAAPAPARPEHVQMSDTNSDAGKVFRARGGAEKAVVPGGAVILDAAGNRLEIAPTKRPALAAPAESVAPVAARLAAKLPELPALDDPKADLATRRRRAELLLAGSAIGAFLLAFWARGRWRPGN